MEVIFPEIFIKLTDVLVDLTSATIHAIRRIIDSNMKKESKKQ